MKPFKLNFIAITGLAILLNVFSSCGGGGLSGNYIADDDNKLTFTSAGKVERSAMGITMAGTYEREENKVILSMGGGNLVMTIDKEGCLNEWGDKFCKAKD